LAELPPIDIDPDAFFRGHTSLPALPELLTQIQEIMHSDNMHIADTATLISGEPALVAQILKVVNSAYYSLPKEIADVKFAIAYLGLNDVYRIALTLSAINTLDIRAARELHEFWEHSFFSALCAKYLAKRYSPHLAQEELWSAAILHDIGKLVYLKFFPEHYKALKKYSKDQGCVFSNAEEHFSFPSSAYLGSLLCEHWRLPSKIKEACLSHGLEDLRSIDIDDISKQFGRIICLANIFAILSYDRLNSESKEELSEAIMSSLECSEKEFLVIMGDIYELKGEVEKIA